MRAERLSCNPLLYPDPHTDARVGSNIAGPSLIRVPAWLPHPLGRYYLYFSHHKGNGIRLAYADALCGPWTIHAPGTLRLEDAHFIDHIASPDAHIDEEQREVRLYYHGVVTASTAPHFVWGSRTEIITPETVQGHQQATRVATSPDGLQFSARPEVLGPAYFRVFQQQGWYYALAMPGRFLRSRDGLSGFESGPLLFSRSMRHAAVLLEGDTLHVFYSNAGDCPERILWTTIGLAGDWQSWQAAAPVTMLEPEREWEGIAEPLEPSARGAVLGPARQLRDPAIYVEDGRRYLLYAAAGEYGIGIAELKD